MSMSGSGAERMGTSGALQELRMREIYLHARMKSMAGWTDGRVDTIMVARRECLPSLAP